MIDLLARATLRSRFALQIQALLVGAVLGWIAWELSRVAHGSRFNLVMALVVVVAGATSFVLYTLHTRATHTPPSPQNHRAAVRNCLSLIGCGVAVSMHGLQASLS